MNKEGKERSMRNRKEQFKFKRNKEGKQKQKNKGRRQDKLNKEEIHTNQNWVWINVDLLENINCIWFQKILGTRKEKEKTKERT